MNERKSVAARARALLESGALGETPARWRVRDALPVESPRGHRRSWWVPLVDGDQLVGFVQLSNEMTLLGCSRLGRPADAAAWLDVASIRERAATVARRGEVAGDAYLSFDRVPARIAWAVELAAPIGQRPRVVFVAGDAVWEHGLGADEIGGAPSG